MRLEFWMLLLLFYRQYWGQKQILIVFCWKRKRLVCWTHLLILCMYISLLLSSFLIPSILTDVKYVQLKVSFCVEDRDFLPMLEDFVKGHTTENVGQMLDLHTMNSYLSSPKYTNMPSIAIFVYFFQFSIVKFAFMLSTPKLCFCTKYAEN